MEKLHSFVTQAREKGLSDEAIRRSLTAQGWDAANVDMAVAGLEVPKPEPSSPVENKSEASLHPFSLSPLMAALHHVILWFFVSSSTVTIGGTVASLYGMNVSSNILASMIAVTLITFVPYAILFAIFLSKTRKNPLLVPGKVWSIITICLNSIGAMIAAIVAVINIITAGDKIYLISAVLIFLLSIIIVITYSFAAFGIHRALRLRTIIISIHLPLLIVMFGILFSMSLLKIGPAKYDEDLRKDLSSLVTKIRANTRENKKLPDTADGMTTNKTIRYEKTGLKTYKVCAPFKTSNSTYEHTNAYYDAENTDAYISESSFYTSKQGESCFEFTSDYLEQQEEDVQESQSLQRFTY